MKVVVFGAGAVGSYLGGILTRRNDVVLVGRAPHVDAIRSGGLQLEGTRKETFRPKAVTGAAEAGGADLVILTVKTYDTASALRGLVPAMGPATVLLVAQNGLGNWDAARAAFPGHAVLGASILVGASLAGPGRVQISGEGETSIGGRAEDEGAATRIVGVFQDSGLKARLTRDLRATLWLKAIVNAAINPLTSIHRVTNGRLVEDTALRRQMREAASEAVRVAAALGIVLPVADPVAYVEEVARTTAGNRSSMLQSVERGQRTEIEGITGKILEAARSVGVPCPVNESLLDAVRTIEVRIG